jgi:GT2 family glycosyltransferase
MTRQKLESLGQQIDDSAQATEDDVLLSYTLFVGRDPESKEIVGARTQQARAVLVVASLESDEFYRNVVLETARGGQPPHSQRSRGPDARTLSWAAANLPIAAETRQRLNNAAPTWRQFFDVLFSDADLRGAVPHLRNDPALVDAILRRGEQRRNTPPREIVGAIESCLGAEIRGWAANLEDLQERVSLELLADGTPIGVATCSHYRGDLAHILTRNGDFGFEFSLPAALNRSYPQGFRLTAVDADSGQAIRGERRIEASRDADLGVLEQIHRRLAEIESALKAVRASVPSISVLTSYSLQEYDVYARHFGSAPSRAVDAFSRAAELAYRPVISIILPTLDPDPLLLEASLESVARQTYGRWQLLICDDWSDCRAELRQIADRVFHADPRVEFVAVNHRSGRPACCNHGIDKARGSYLCFLEVGDELSNDALFHVAQSLGSRRPKLLYSDEDRVLADASGRRSFHSPYFKPDFDWDLLIGQNYLSRLLVADAALARSVGGLRSGFEGADDLDFVLRCLEQTEDSQVCHIPRVLYHWRMSADVNYDSAGRSEQVEGLRIACVNDHLRRRGLSARAEPLVDAFAGRREGAIGLRWTLPDEAPAVSVIIPTRDGADLLRECLSSLSDAIDAYAGSCEFIIVDNESADPDTRQLLTSLNSPTTRVLPFKGPFNWSAINNEGAHNASGDVLLFLNNDAFVKEMGSLGRLVAQAMRPDVGVVGARLIYRDGAIQHAGVILGVDGHSAHDGMGLPVTNAGYFGRHHLTHQASAVTGACFATRRAVFDEIGGFDPGFRVTCSDADYCLRAGERGYKTIYDPGVVFYHLESRTRGPSQGEQGHRQAKDELRFQSRWAAKINQDPFYNPHFERYFAPFTRVRLLGSAAERHTSER